jgi:hypothetical protein
MQKSYEAPTLKLIGSVAELTLQFKNKVSNPVSDGFLYQGNPINFS